MTTTVINPKSDWFGQESQVVCDAIIFLNSTFKYKTEYSQLDDNHVFTMGAFSIAIDTPTLMNKDTPASLGRQFVDFMYNDDQF